MYIFVVLIAHFPRFVRLKNKKTRKINANLKVSKKNRHLPKHKLVLDVINHKHKACTKDKYSQLFSLQSCSVRKAQPQKLMTSRHLPKHRLVLVVINHKHKTCMKGQIFMLYLSAVLHKLITKFTQHIYDSCSIKSRRKMELPNFQLNLNHRHKACTRTNIHSYIPAVLLKLMTFRHFPKHRLVLVVINHKHKACTRTNIHSYFPPVLLTLMTSRHLPKHRLVLVIINHKHKACTGTNT